MTRSELLLPDPEPTIDRGLMLTLPRGKYLTAEEAALCRKALGIRLPCDEVK